MGAAFFLGLGILLLVILLYLAGLAVAALWPEKKEGPCPPRTKFAVLIPAHNEEESIAATLHHALEVDYPAGLYEIFVMADTCSDRTEEIVRSLGIACWKYEDTAHRGKGYVLRWAFARLLEAGDHDAFVVLDADTYMDADFLQVINTCFCRGALAVQGYSQVRHPERSVMESLAFLGFALNRNLRYRGRSRIGWSANLMGTGMCFCRQVLERYGWPAISMVEDIEYQMLLRMHGIPVVFAADARVSVELHAGAERSGRQRARWDMGKFQVRNRYLPALLKRGIGRLETACFDSVMELLLPPFSLFFFLVVICFVLYLLLGFHAMDTTFFIWLAVVLILFLYTAAGLVTAKADRRVYRSLLSAPGFILWRLKIVLLECCRGKKQHRW